MPHFILLVLSGQKMQDKNYFSKIPPSFGGRATRGFPKGAFMTGATLETTAMRRVISKLGAVGSLSFGVFKDSTLVNREPTPSDGTFPFCLLFFEIILVISKQRL